MKQIKNIRWLLVGLLCLVAAVAGGYAISYYANLSAQQNKYEQLAQSVAVPTAAPESTPASSSVDIPIDFAALQAEYPDIYAWIEIPDTEVAYPILQHPTDDTYYLNYNLDGTKGYPGCIYSELWNAKDFSDFDTILYGHNMKNGTMFGSLKQYRDPDFLQQHREIIVYTPAEKLVYRVFAAVVYSDAYLPKAFDMTDAAERTKYLESLQNTHNLNSQYLTDISVDSESRILTLSTCIGGQPNNRFLVEAVYVGAE